MEIQFVRFSLVFIIPSEPEWREFGVFTPYESICAKDAKGAKNAKRMFFGFSSWRLGFLGVLGANRCEVSTRAPGALTTG